MTRRFLLRPLTLATLLGLACTAQAADWSDTSIGYRYGTKFGEPFEGNAITKDIFDLQHVSGYKYGVNFFNLDMLMSNKNDPAGPTSHSGAQEAYVVYRNTLDLAKVTSYDYKWGFVKDLGVTGGFDWNTKTDAGYNSKKRMLVIGPTAMLDVPGFLDASLVELYESNAPCDDYTHSCVARYHYRPHPMLTLAFGIPFNLGVPLSFEGYADFISAKGKDEFHNNTAPETNIDAEIMYDIGSILGAAPKTYKLGFEYQYWKNKFGNSYKGAAGSGAFAKTPMVRFEYHF